MKTVCKADACSGCMACVDICPRNAINIKDSVEAFNAEIDESKCIQCGLCEKTCPNLNLRRLCSPMLWKQGWAEDEIRRNSSSGGAASAIIRSFILNGGFVASCLFENGEFTFAVTDDCETAKRFAGSKYVKSNPGKIYQTVKKLLIEGNKVLFIGLPCQSAAVQNYCMNHQNLYTADLICHGTPSPKLLDMFLNEEKITMDEVTDIGFRKGNKFGVTVNGKRLSAQRVRDSYMMTFLKCVDYTENCYSCRYASDERVSDITLGDAWGLLSETEKDGVSLILCQTPKGMEILENAGLHLEDADPQTAIKANKQLQHPSVKHPGREKFIHSIKKGKNFQRAAYAAMPKEWTKQNLKAALIRFHLMKDHSN